MKLTEGYYWVKTIVVYHTGRTVRDDVPTIGFYNENEDWDLIGSDEIFHTFKVEPVHGHPNVYVIPIKKVKK